MGWGGEKVEDCNLGREGRNEGIQCAGRGVRSGRRERDSRSSEIIEATGDRGNGQWSHEA
jgi:hypothetical protein